MTRTIDPYKLLGVPRDASSAEIRRSFRRLAFAVHPDRNREAGANDAFMALRQAYSDAMSGFEVDPVSPDEVVDEMVRAASEVERRRGHAGQGAKAWQRVRVPLLRPFRSRLRAIWGDAEDWAVELHWTGLVDLRSGVVVAWTEIAGVKEQNCVLDVVLTPAGSRRLSSLAELAEGETIYRFPLGTPSRLAGLIRQQIGN